MKILEINTEPSWRGGERQTYLNMLGFRELGLDVELLAKHGGTLAQKSANADFQTHAIQSRWEGLKFLIRNGKNYDILHAQTSKAQLLAVLSKPFHQRPVVYSRRVNFKISGFFTKLKYHFTDKVVAITNEVRKNIENFGVKNVSVITDVVEIQNINKPRAKDFILKNNWQNKKIIATVAAFTEEKDPKTLVKSIAHLKTLRNDFVFLHFGEGKLKESSLQIVNDLKINEVYQFVGYHEDIQDFYSVFDVFVLTSQQEGLGSSILDAFIQRVPVVATRAGGITETVENQGILCDIGNAVQIAEGLHRLLNDQELRDNFTQKAYQTVTTKHSNQRIAEAYFKVFTELLS
ncbi:MAG: glycosyltransferase family 4 protein [Arcicella sp.]|jgi:glycosyltransferase involved in cell wall biosynthesis|nr:glycosyltransferase family 4 protein [Arcicella sp.]